MNSTAPVAPGLPIRAQSVARTHIGLVREANEDRLLDAPAKGLWAVADGMGGLSLGDEAAAIVIRALAQLLDQAAPIDRGLIENALIQANSDILALASNVRKTCGSTVAGIHIDATRCTAFWAGDSRVYRFRDGALDRLTRDHRVVQEMLDAGVIGETDAQRHPHANVITRALGVERDCQVEFVNSDARGGDMYLIATDGLTDHLDDGALQRQITSNPAGSAAAFLEATLADGAKDNVSLIVVSLASGWA